MRFLLVLLAACGAAQSSGAHGRRSTTGSIGGLARDLASGESVANATVKLSTGATTTTGPAGLYSIDDIKPGTYSLVATYAGQPVTVTNILIDAGQVTFVDINFTLGNAEPITLDYGAQRGEVIHYVSKRGQTTLEGAVSDMTTRERVSGAVVTAVGGSRNDTLQTVTDEQGRYRFDAVDPGTYVVSAY
ncbi:MAG TPA: carboxypeptidase-like regulatory domain-containing protein, partial [Kofleriaceae bacterium]